jgi:hypothetical protein
MNEVKLGRQLRTGPQSAGRWLVHCQLCLECTLGGSPKLETPNLSFEPASMRSQRADRHLSKCRRRHGLTTAFTRSGCASRSTVNRSQVCESELICRRLALMCAATTGDTFTTVACETLELGRSLAMRKLSLTFLGLTDGEGILLRRFFSRRFHPLPLVRRPLLISCKDSSIVAV